MVKMDQQTAESIAIAGLARLAGDEDLLLRFSALSGILPNDIRDAAGQPGFLVGVLDFYLAHEPDLLDWTGSDQLNPESIMLARHALSPNDMQGFE